MVTKRGLELISRLAQHKDDQYLQFLSRCAKQTLSFCFGISLFKSLDLVILNLLSQAHCRHFWPSDFFLGVRVNSKSTSQRPPCVLQVQVEKRRYIPERSKRKMCLSKILPASEIVGHLNRLVNNEVWPLTDLQEDRLSLCVQLNQPGVRCVRLQ